MVSRRAFRLGGRILAGLLAGTAAVSAGTSRYFADKILAVERVRSYDIEVLAVDGDRVRLSSTADSELPGTYGLSWPESADGEPGHAVVGDRIDLPDDDDSVTRPVLTVSQGTLRPGLRVAWEQYTYLGTPRHARGLDYADLDLSGELGSFAAWLLPGDGRRCDRWVIAVHGRGGNRGETMRIQSTLAELGLPTIIPAYRNDEGAPPSPDRRYHLGDTEWHEIDAAMRYARDHGAKEIVLYGWSMGGAIVLQAQARSELRHLVIGLILDSPVIDWRDTLRANAKVNHLPPVVCEPGLVLVARRLGIDLDDFDWVRRAEELTLPTLLFHGPDDDFVPWHRGLELARKRADLVRLITYPGAAHTKSWNVNPVGYEREVATFLTDIWPDPPT